MADDTVKTITKFHPALIFLHWVMVLLITSVYITMELSDYFPRGSSERLFLKSTHFSLGVSVLFLVLIRICIRLATPAPVITPSLLNLQYWLARLVQLALYIFMLCMPILGWLILSIHGKSVPFFGLHLPALVAANEDLHDLLHGLHEKGAFIGYFLIGGHAGMALLHHYIRRDNTLVRMLFSRKK